MAFRKALPSLFNHFRKPLPLSPIILTVTFHMNSDTHIHWSNAGISAKPWGIKIRADHAPPGASNRPQLRIWFYSKQGQVPPEASVNANSTYCLASFLTHAHNTGIWLHICPLPSASCVAAFSVTYRVWKVCLLHCYHTRLIFVSIQAYMVPL